jgi:hypothetical protein
VEEGSVAWGRRRSGSRITGSCSPAASRAWSSRSTNRRGNPLGMTMAAVEGAEHQGGVPDEVQGH